MGEKKNSREIFECFSRKKGEVGRRWFEYVFPRREREGVESVWPIEKRVNIKRLVKARKVLIFRDETG